MPIIKKLVSIKELCEAVGMTYDVLGVTDICVTIPSPIDDAAEKSVSFCSKKDDIALSIIKNSIAKVIICSNKMKFTPEDYQDKTLILVSNPRLAFIRIMQKYFQERIEPGIHPTAIIDKEAEIHPGVYIGPHCYVGKCQIGEGAIIYGNVYIYPNVHIGQNVIINAGTVIGADGFSYERNENGELEKFPHIGGVIIESDVEIGSNVSIDRGTMGNTIIGQGTKIDNLCHIAHNVAIGKHCLIIAQSMIGGSTKIGDYSWIAPQSCIRDGIEIGKNVIVGMGSVVTKSISDGLVVFGVPAKENRIG